MPRIAKAKVLVLSGCLAIGLALAGCGGAVPDEPAKLTPDQEQEILRQVEQASSGEQNAVP